MKWCNQITIKFFFINFLLISSLISVILLNTFNFYCSNEINRNDVSDITANMINNEIYFSPSKAIRYGD